MKRWMDPVDVQGKKNPDKMKERSVELIVLVLSNHYYQINIFKRLIFTF